MAAQKWFTPFELINTILPMACKATAVVPAIDATASVPQCSGPYSCPQFQQVATTPNFMYIVAGILYKESSFNWQVYGQAPSNGPQVPGTQGTFIANYNAALSLGAPGIIATPAGTPQTPYSPQQVQSASSCSVLDQASRAQSLSQCLGTYHLANTPSSPFSQNPIGRGLIFPIYHPPFGDLGINAIYNGPNYTAGAINGFIAMMTLMAQANPINQPWSGDGDVESLGRSIMGGGTINQLQNRQTPPPVSSPTMAGATVFSPPNSGGNPVAC